MTTDKLIEELRQFAGESERFGGEATAPEEAMSQAADALQFIQAERDKAVELAALAMDERRKEWGDCIEAGCKRVSVSIRTAEAIRVELEWAAHKIRSLTKGDKP